MKINFSKKFSLFIKSLTIEKIIFAYILRKVVQQSLMIYHKLMMDYVIFGLHRSILIYTIHILTLLI